MYGNIYHPIQGAQGIVANNTSCFRIDIIKINLVAIYGGNQVGKKFGYARVSTAEQNEARQIKEFKKQGVNEALIFTDKASGKDFNRPEYTRLKAILSAGDELYIHSIDRLGRNKQQTKAEFEELKNIGVIIRVLNLPTTLIEVPAGSEAMFDMINNLMLEVLTTMAEQERKNIRSMQRQGIDAMVVDSETGKKVSQKTGNATGRPARKFPIGWEDAYKSWKEEKLTATATMEVLGLKRNTFYRLVKDYEMVQSK
ncbi:recombinase family protein [Clostridium manihotivorum]|nr:recombinase family protein [Clostridium manihotivorum]